MNKWWGYLHTSGSIHAKRYFDEGDLVEARESDFVAKMCPVFEAESAVQAYKHIRDFFLPVEDEPEDAA